MNYLQDIETEIAVLNHIGYSEQDVARLIGIYSGYPTWRELSLNQQRRLATDLHSHARIARKWYLATAGRPAFPDLH